MRPERVLEGKRILLVGNADSVAIKKLVEDFYAPAGASISLTGAYSSKYADFYEATGVRGFAVDDGLPAPLMGIPKVTGGLQAALRLARMDGGRKGEEFDFVQAHFVDRRAVRIALSRRFSTAKRIASFWGSDLLRASDSQAAWLKSKLSRFDAITVQRRATMLGAFEDRMGPNLGGRLHTVLFPGESEGIMEAVSREPPEVQRGRFGIPPGKLVVTVGYNANPMQQHVPVIESLGSLPGSVKARIHLLFPMTYPEGNAAYRRQVEGAASDAGFTSTSVEEFLDEEDLARLRVASHVFVHAQVSDAASASVREYLKAGCVVFNPSWIDYWELRDMGVEYVEYDSFGDLVRLFERALMGEVDVDVLGNMRLLNTSAYHEEVVSSWEDLFGSFE